MEVNFPLQQNALASRQYFCLWFRRRLGPVVNIFFWRSIRLGPTKFLPLLPRLLPPTQMSEKLSQDLESADWISQVKIRGKVIGWLIHSRCITSKGIYWSLEGGWEEGRAISSPNLGILAIYTFSGNVQGGNMGVTDLLSIRGRTALVQTAPSS